MKSHYLKAAGSVFAAASLLILTGCGGGNKDKDGDNGGNGGGGTGNSIDLSQYVIPASNRVNEYDMYDIDEGDIDRWGSFSESWQISGNTATVDVTYDDSSTDNYTITVNSNELDFGGEFTAPRNITSGQKYTDSDGDDFIVFGPYSSRTFSVGGKSPSRTDNDVIVMIYKIDWGSDIDIDVLHFAKGKGMVGAHYFWDCPSNISLSISENYASKCGDNFYEAEFLKNHR